ncbi:MAG: hypothetical protein ACP5KZ_04245 [bacterium]
MNIKLLRIGIKGIGRIKRLLDSDFSWVLLNNSGKGENDRFGCIIQKERKIACIPPYLLPTNRAIKEKI